MRDSFDPTASEIEVTAAEEGKTRKRPRPGERRLQILQVLAEMLQIPRVNA